MRQMAVRVHALAIQMGFAPLLSVAVRLYLDGRHVEIEREQRLCTDLGSRRFNQRGLGFKHKGSARSPTRVPQDLSLLAIGDGDGFPCRSHLSPISVQASHAALMCSPAARVAQNDSLPAVVVTCILVTTPNGGFVAPCY